MVDECKRNFCKISKIVLSFVANNKASPSVAEFKIETETTGTVKKYRMENKVTRFSATSNPDS